MKNIDLIYAKGNWLEDYIRDILSIAKEWGVDILEK